MPSPFDYGYEPTSVAVTSHYTELSTYADVASNTQPLALMVAIEQALLTGGWTEGAGIKATQQFNFIAILPRPDADPSYIFTGTKDWGTLQGKHYVAVDVIGGETNPTGSVDGAGNTIIGFPLTTTANSYIQEFCNSVSLNSDYNVVPIPDAITGSYNTASITAKFGGPQWNYPQWAPNEINVFSSAPSGGGWLFKSAADAYGNKMTIAVTHGTTGFLSITAYFWKQIDDGFGNLSTATSGEYRMDRARHYSVHVTPYTFAMWRRQNSPETQTAAPFGQATGNVMLGMPYAPTAMLPGPSYGPVGFAVSGFQNIGGGTAHIQAGDHWTGDAVAHPGFPQRWSLYTPDAGDARTELDGPRGTPIECAAMLGLNGDTSITGELRIHGYYPGSFVRMKSFPLDRIEAFEGQDHICASTAFDIFGAPIGYSWWFSMTPFRPVE